jgi:hypothetical protein
MRHALILRVVRLPLIAALGFCIAVVAMTAYSQYSAEPVPGRSGQRPTAEAPVDSEIVAVNRVSRPDVSRDTRIVMDPGRAERLGPTLDCDPAAPAQAESAVSRQTVHSRLLDIDALMTSCPAGSAVWRIGMGGRWYASVPNAPSFDITRLIATTDSPITATAPDRGTDLPPSAGDEDGTMGDAEPQGATAAASTELRNERIYLRNAPENRYSVTYLIDGQVFELEQGEEVTLAAGQATVRFDRGGGSGTVTQDLVAGRYEFRLSASGWKLRPATR